MDNFARGWNDEKRRMLLQTTGIKNINILSKVFVGFL